MDRVTKCRENLLDKNLIKDLFLCESHAGNEVMFLVVLPFDRGRWEPATMEDSVY